MFFNHLKSDFILLSDPYKIRQIHSNLEFVKMQFSVKSIVFIFFFFFFFFFTSHGGFLLSITRYVSGVGISVAGLNRAKFRFYRFQRFCLLFS